MLMFALLVCLTKLVNCMFFESNTTDLSNCVISYSRSGSVYKEFYPLNLHENDTLVLDFHFAVLAANDAHILLAEHDNVSKTDPAYEIVIGAGGNTFSDIRRMQKSEVKQSTRIKGLLSVTDPRFFWLHLTKDGTLQVGVEGQNKSFIEWMDPEPLHVKFVSFSTWSGVEAKWYFNCDRSLSKEEALKRLPTMAKLRRSLLQVYDPLVRPVKDEMSTMEIQMSLDVMDLEFDEDNIFLAIRGSSRLKWHDENLSWDSSLFENISIIYADRKEIWTPPLKCFQTVDSTNDFLLDSILIVNKVGTVLWDSTFRMMSACQSSDKGDWPRDIYVCKVFFGLTDYYSGVILNFSCEDSNLLVQKDGVQWTVLEALLVEDPVSNSSFHTPVWKLLFEMRRSSLIYSTVFLLPLIAITTCLLFSFWVSPNGNTKLFLGCSQLIIEMLILLSLAYFIPHRSDGVPLLIILYGLCFACSLTGLIITIIVLNLCKKKRSKPLPHAVSNLITKKMVKKALILPNVVMPEDYGDLDMSLSLNNMSRTSDKDHSLWILLAMAIERIFFIFYLIFMTVIIIKYVMACF